MEQAKISIIVPVYQVEKYLRRCLDSIINQTYRNLEIILVEDGSKDASPAICEEYAQKDSRIKVYYQENQGASVARNKGLDVATGEYIGFVDSDDWLELDMYEKLYAAFIEDSIQVTVVGFYWESEEKTYAISVDPQKYYSAAAFLAGTVLDKNGAISAVWSKLYRKELFRQVRFVPDVRGEDNICMVDLFGAKPNFAIVDGCLYHYNKMNSQSVTCKMEPKMEYGYFVFLSRYLRLSEEFLQHRNVEKQIRADILKRAIRCYIENLVVHQMSNERLKDIDTYLRGRENYVGVDQLKLRHRALCWCYNHCRDVLSWYARIRY